MQALISTTEPVKSGYRVAQVEPDNNIFAVAESLFWTPCSDEVIPDFFWYDPSDNTIKNVYPTETTQPTTTGAQTL